MTPVAPLHFCVAGVAQSYIHGRFGVAGVAQSRIHARFAWQAASLMALGGALGPGLDFHHVVLVVLFWSLWPN